MFNKNFFPTPAPVIEQMIGGESLEGKTILEPSAGKGDIVDYCKAHGAEVLACEIVQDLRTILASKCNLIGQDFLDITSDQVSHVDFIVMNPPFNADEKHILHAYKIATAGCKIIALCNLNTVKNTYSRSREELGKLIESCGSWEDLGPCFDEAERKTGVEVALIRMQKEGAGYKAEFEGFFMDEEPEQAEGQESGLMSYNSIRDLVHRYIMAVKLFDEQLNTGVKMAQITSGFYSSSLAFSCTEDGKPKARNDFKKDLQKNAWKYIFAKMNMQKHTTRGLKEDINNFIEKQTQVPFTMKNIFRMLEIVIGTTGQRMDKAILEAFDNVTRHYDENRFNVEGWKTNSHYLLNRRFIFPYAAEKDWGGQHVSFKYYNSNGETLADLEKALCYLTGENWDSFNNDATETKPAGDGFRLLPRKMIPGQWYDTHFFRIRGYKKGTIHCEFRDEKLWGRFNQHVAKLKGYPLFESTGKKKDYGQPKEKKAYTTRPTGKAGKVLFTVKVKEVV